MARHQVFDVFVNVADNEGRVPPLVGRCAILERDDHSCVTPWYVIRFGCHPCIGYWSVWIVDVFVGGSGRWSLTVGAWISVLNICS